MKSKTKNTKPKITKSRKRVKHFACHYLALAVLSLMLLEGALFSITTPSDWKEAVSILDMGSGVAETADNLSLAFQPIVQVYNDVNNFYAMAATAAIPLLDMSGTEQDIAIVFEGVNEFYEQASVQMAQVLDLSSVSNWPSRVAGASITVK